MSNFEQVFQSTLDQVEASAKEEGMTMTSICRDLGISRATPDRWRKEPPKTIEILTKMQNLVEERRLRRGKDALHQD